VEENYLYKGKVFTRAELEAKYGENTDRAIKEFSFELVGQNKNKPSNPTDRLFFGVERT